MQSPRPDWPGRIETLLKATGWSKNLMGRKFGFYNFGPLRRILNGGRPSVALLLTLQRLEGVYAREIDALNAGAIKVDPTPRRIRWDFRADRSTGARRPEDLAEVGKVGSAGKDPRTGRADGLIPGVSTSISPEAPQRDDNAASRRSGDTQDRAARDRRSQAHSDRQGRAATGDNQ